MHPETKYTEVSGIPSGREIVVYGLLRCAPCKEARDFLEQKGWRYKYVHLERQPQELRARIKKGFAAAHGARPIYPVLELDGTYYFGFDRVVWEQLIAGNDDEAGGATS
ncbi:MAG: glutaredoxin family protein [Spirochaetaceae bacterium]